MTNQKDQEVTLKAGNYRAVIGAHGASLRQLSHLEKDGKYSDLIWGYSGAQNKQGGQGDVLMPFPSRIKEGQYRFDGKTQQLKINDKEGPNAIHGFVREKLWDITRQSDGLVELHTHLRPDEFQGYPFSLDLSVIYSLGLDGFKCSFSAKNVGDRHAPFGAGFHPYFTTGAALDDEEVKMPVTDFLVMENLIPTGKMKPVMDSPVDFRSFRRLGSTRLNHCFMRLIRDNDGMARAQIRNPHTARTLTVWMDSAFKCIVAYTGDQIPEPWTRKACAIEPMTCATDAFNHSDLAEWGMKTLQPGETFSGTYGVELTTGNIG